MTFSTTHRAYNDPELRARVDAATMQEAFARAGSNEFADRLVSGVTMVPPAFYWRVASDYTAAYEGAVNSGRGAPGHDVDVITDGNITAAIGAVWPQDPVVEPGP